MKLIEFIMQVVALVVPESVLSKGAVFGTNWLADGSTEIFTIFTIQDVIEHGLTFAVAFCMIYFLVWVPFRGVLHLINWKRWRGY